MGWNAAAGRSFDIAVIQIARFPDSDAAGAAHQRRPRQRLHQALGPARRVGPERLAVSGSVSLAIAARVGVYGCIPVPNERAHRVVPPMGPGSSLLLLSVYFVTSIGLTGDNLDLLSAMSPLVGQYTDGEIGTALRTICPP